LGQQPISTNIPVILLTSAANLSVGIQEPNVADRMVKPVKQVDLRETILKVQGTWQQNAQSQETQATPTVQHAHRILLAEDNPVNQKLAMRLLEKAGYQVSLASNGEEVLAKMKTNTFDAILMDIQMPQMGGIEATEIIRQNETNTDKRLPIIALTAHALNGDKERFLDAGMDAYVAKPIQREQLFKTLSEYLPTT